MIYQQNPKNRIKMKNYGKILFEKLLNLENCEIQNYFIRKNKFHLK